MNKMFGGWCMSSNSECHPLGRIWVMWNKRKAHIQVVDRTAQTIHCKARELMNNEYFWITFVYAFNDQGSRLQLWESLKGYSENMKSPWCCVGDYNIILEVEDRKGGNLVSNDDIKDFKSCILDCGLEEIPWVGPYYTWSNKQGSGNRIWSRIDRALSNAMWMGKYGTKTRILSEGISDHTPLLITKVECYKANPFRFCNMWLEDPSLDDILKEEWRSESSNRNMFQLMQNMKKLKGPLRKLHSAKYKRIHMQMEEAREELTKLQQELQHTQMTKELCEQEKELRDKLYKAIRASYSMKCQLSKQEWFTEGDKGSKLFYAWIKKRTALNYIVEIQNEEGVMKQREELLGLTGMKLGELPFTYLGSPITTARLKRSECDALINKLTCRITAWRTRHFSYSARVRIINSVLMGITTFWSRIFILPRRVIKEIMAISRNFLWGSSSNYTKVPLVNWEEVCQKKKFGGLGIMNALNWNHAAIMKLNWDVAGKKDVLWVKWIHSKYLKASDYWEYKPKKDVCHYWTEMIKVREKFKDMPKVLEYKIKDGYDWLQGTKNILEWKDAVWNSITPPKMQWDDKSPGARGHHSEEGAEEEQATT
ncbi:hypothetical protein DM860_011795 [Cuscuta australis]|uniref:Reverse transcriptase zinc-binding domain-containing protein n=1 Tax=Cuscuta australis TaxID=267555 RepID=A0A328DIQ4_9ASTE|nr:hypothetical protein DM860_011795 [Cuscuta australis]